MRGAGESLLAPRWCLRAPRDGKASKSAQVAVWNRWIERDRLVRSLVQDRCSRQALQWTLHERSKGTPRSLQAEREQERKRQLGRTSGAKLRGMPGQNPGHLYEGR